MSKSKDTAKEMAIQDTLRRLKAGTPDFQSFIKVATAYERSMRAMLTTGAAFCDALQKLGENFRGDLQEGILRMAESQREIERRRLEMSDHLLREVIQPLGRSIDAEARYEVPAFEREYSKRKKKLTADLHAAEKITQRTGRKAKNARPEDLQKNIKILTERVKDLDKLRSDSLRRVMLMERKRGCDFLRMFTRVAEMQLFQFTEGYNILNDNREFWAELSAARDTLPADDEELLSVVSAVTAERTFVPLQTAAAQQSGDRVPPQHYEPYSNNQQPPPPPQQQQQQQQQQAFSPPPPPPAGGAVPGYGAGGYDQGGYDDQAYDQGYDQGGYDDQGGYYEEPAYGDLPPPADLPPPPGLDDFADNLSGVLGSSPPDDGRPKCIALFEYVAQRPDELNLQVDDIIYILKEDEGWWEGENQAGLRGVFPCNFVERLEG